VTVKVSFRSDVTSAVVVGCHFAFTYLPVYLAAATKPGLLWIGLWLWFGIAKNGLINLMHECAHRLVFRRSWANEFLGTSLLAPLLITDFESYRERHWEHHRHLGTAKDPKLVYHTDVRGFGIAKLFVRCLVGIEAVRRLTEKAPESDGPKQEKANGLSLRTVIVQALFSASLLAVALLARRDAFSALVSAVLAYTLIYVYGLLSLTVFAAAVRAIAEHQRDTAGDAERGDAALRNLRCNVFTRLALGAYGFGEHATHHTRPTIPYYELPRLTAELAREDSMMVPRSGYLSVVARIVVGKTA
jgi:fatty acid desaturase